MVARRLELGGTLVGLALAWSVAGSALPELLLKANSTDTVFEDFIPDPFRARVFAVAASSTLERVGLGLLLGAALVASSVLAAGIFERRRLRPSPVPASFGLAAAALVAFATRDALSVGVVLLVVAASVFGAVERRSAPILCAGAALAASAGAWIAQAGQALNGFALAGAAQAPELATVLSHWPHVALCAGAGLLLCLGAAVRLARSRSRHTQSIWEACSLSLGLVIPGACLAGWTVSALDARATCNRASDARLDTAWRLPGPAAIGECVPRNLIIVSKTTLQIDDSSVAQGSECELRLAEVLSQRFSEHFIMPTQGTTMGDLECVLRGLLNGQAVRGMWQRSDPAWAIPSSAGTSNAFVALGEQQGAPWPLLDWNRLPLRTNVTLVEQRPQSAKSTLRLTQDEWSWGNVGRLEPLLGSPEERMRSAKDKLGAEPFVVFELAPDVPASVLLELLRSAQQPLLLLPPKTAPGSSRAAGPSRQQQLLNEVNEVETGASSQPAAEVTIAIETKLLQGEISVPDLEAALAVLPRRLGSCWRSMPQKETRLLVRFFVQRYGDVVNIVFAEKVASDAEQNCVRRVFERLRPPIPSSSVAHVETTVVIAAAD